MKIPKRYYKTLNSYLKFYDQSNKYSSILNSYLYSLSGIGANEAMFKIESLGVKITDCKEPELLTKYLIGKWWKDWHISEWTKGLKERTTFIPEIRTTGLLTEKELHTLAKNTFII